MQSDLKNLLILIEKSFKTEDSSKLQSLEKEIVEISSNIEKTISSSENVDYQLNRHDLEKLEILIKKISSKQEDKKKFLSDFQDFVKNRKIN